ncbi:rolling circle replication-associated protein [Nocardioides marmoraquaticus]
MSSSHLSSITRPDAGWALNLYPSAGEAGGSFVSSYRPSRSWVPGTPAADPARARAEAGRRARGKVRRYCAANRLTRFGTLTYAGSGKHDPVEVRADVARFFRSLRSSLDGRTLPYVWVPEWHKTDHGLHLHFALGQYVNYRLIRSTWGHGFISIKRHTDLAVGSGPLQESRKAANYLSKYISKSFDNDAPSRALQLHRYDLAQGFQPRPVRLEGRSSEQLLGEASELMSGKPTRLWSSRDVEGWQGPPAVWAAWG